MQTYESLVFLIKSRIEESFKSFMDLYKSIDSYLAFLIACLLEKGNHVSYELSNFDGIRLFYIEHMDE